MQLGSQVFYSHRIWRTLSFHGGYTRTQARFGDSGWSPPFQTLDFGLDYNDGLTFQLSRHTTLQLSAALGSARTVPGITQYRVLGSATLAHSISRTWIASTGVSRNLSFVAAFRQPVLYDTAYGMLSGQLTNRISSTSSITLSRGYVNLDQSRHYDTSAASTALSFGLTRRLGAFAQYTYYRTRIPADLTTLAVMQSFGRQTASVGLSVFQPIFNTARTTP
jgi:hypothetical protein